MDKPVDKYPYEGPTFVRGIILKERSTKMRTIPVINYKDGNGNPVRKVLFEIKENEKAGYVSIGIGMGADIFHCIYLGSRYTNDFLNRVVCYLVKENDEVAKFAEQKLGQKYVTIEFFEKI